MSESGSHLLVGVLLAALSAVAYSTNTPLSALVFAGGGSAILVVISRAAGAVIISSLLIQVRHDRESKPCGFRALSILSVLLFAQGAFYVASVAYIPVSLAALIFFTWPVWVGITTVVVSNKLADAGSLIYFGIALTGLVVALQADFHSLDPLGITLALAGAISMAAYVLLAARLVPPGASPVQLNRNINLGIVACAGFAIAFFSEFSLPDTFSSVGFLGVIAVCYTVATLTQLIAIRLSGPAVAALFFNIEPVSSILLAILILDESLSVQQLAGGVIVVVTLTIYTARNLLRR